MASKPPELRARKATPADSEAMYAWRNDPETRRYFFDPAPLSADSHARWLSASLANAFRHLLIIEYPDGRPVGVVRFDVHREDNAARIDIYLVPERRGAGLGAQVLQAAILWLKENTQVQRIDAEVLSGNHASRRLFEAAGFSLASLAYTLDVNESRR